MRPGGHGHAHAEPRVHGIARVGRLVEQRLEILAAADRRQVDPLPVDRDLDIVRVLESANDVEIRAVQLRLEHVVAVERKRIAHRGPADRAERQPVDVLVLRQILADAEGVAAGRDVGIADGDGRNLHRRRDVFLLQRRGHAEHVRDVVEPVRGVVWRQERRDVHVEIEQVVHRVRVLAAVQPMQNGSAGIGMGSRVGVEVAFERRLQPPVRRLVRAPRTLWRHGAGLKLPHHLLPELRLGPGPGDVQPFERQLARLQTLVMTADAVPDPALRGSTAKPGPAELEARRLPRRRARTRPSPVQPRAGGLSSQDNPILSHLVVPPPNRTTQRPPLAGPYIPIISAC